MTHIATSAALSIGAIASWLTVGAAVSAAAPTGPSAAETIARLQADGKRVIVNKVGSGPLSACTVTNVRTVVVRPQAKTVTIHGLPDFEPIPTVHVNLTC
ncbi:hypothetical protein A5731_29730 [Mycolicibacterium conceptionense]|uniref:Uncharacterized protein n=2 Tax=Mycolicibacterium TaxID=1866885 RepID=A0A1A1Y062_9MYCO|nr:MULTISPECIES: hypothetical protein [Mycolicibacterium]MCW1819531.1 hypothetical protein [Mycolicibacterium senegalense]OBB08475.1 hypothetical protein A5718_13480 [Mycolicibacterium conceptionense]OBE92136.1 hypothetical protein A5731_29730 [Mycolicibacterium conceptionense]OBF24626.1 hypothetical protein A5726_08290 [Mycolicibacterium conceptionense]OBF45180.1 hypothetical protein A5720_09590 [Mycolicibacterium conceptionense]